LTIAALGFGCGSVANHGLTDASGRGDGGADADASGTANVTTKTHVPGFGAVGAIQANVPVISFLPNGDVLDTQMSDTTGKATIKVYPGGSVTAVYAHKAPDMGTDFATYFGVKTNDTLTFGEAFADPTPVGSMTLTWGAVAGVSYYDLYTPCNGYYTGTATSQVITETAGCHVPNMGIEVVAYNAAGTAIALLATTQTFTLNATQNIGTPSATPLSHTANLTFSGINPLVNELDYTLGVVQNGQVQSAYYISGNGVPAGGALNATAMPWVTAVGDRELFVAYQYEENTNDAPIVVYDSFPTTQLTWTVASPPQLPEFPYNSALVSPESNFAAWFTVGAQPTTGTLASAQWTRQIAGTNYVSNWSFILPPGMQAFAFPKLPSPYDKALPTQTDFIDQYSISQFLVPSLADYDALRAMPESIVECLPCATAQGIFDRVVMNVDSRNFED